MPIKKDIQMDVLFAGPLAGAEKRLVIAAVVARKCAEKPGIVL